MTPRLTHFLTPFGPFTAKTFINRASRGSRLQQDQGTEQGFFYKAVSLQFLMMKFYNFRLPWQDVHAKVVGPAARDIMVNFVERSVNAIC